MRRAGGRERGEEREREGCVTDVIFFQGEPGLSGANGTDGEPVRSCEAK